MGTKQQGFPFPPKKHTVLHPPQHHHQISQPLQRLQPPRATAAVPPETSKVKVRMPKRPRRRRWEAFVGGTKGV